MKEKYTALHYAAYSKMNPSALEDIVQFLVEKKAEINCTSKVRVTMQLLLAFASFCTLKKVLTKLVYNAVGGLSS